jgi:hypothetical protein
MAAPMMPSSNQTRSDHKSSLPIFHRMPNHILRSSSYLIAISNIKMRSHRRLFKRIYRGIVRFPVFSGTFPKRESQPCDRSGARAGGSTATPLLVLARSQTTFFPALILDKNPRIRFHRPMIPETLDDYPFDEILNRLARKTLTSPWMAREWGNLNSQSLGDKIKRDILSKYPQLFMDGKLPMDIWIKICNEVDCFIAKKRPSNFQARQVSGMFSAAAVLKQPAAIIKRREPCPYCGKIIRGSQELHKSQCRPSTGVTQHSHSGRDAKQVIRCHCGRPVVPGDTYCYDHKAK